MMRGLRGAVLAGLFALSSGANAVLIGDTSGRIHELDPATNTASLIGGGGAAWLDIAVDPISGGLYGVSDGLASSLYVIDGSTGSRTLVGATGAFINALAFDAGGILYGAGGTRLYTVDPATGAATMVGSTGFASSGDLAFDGLGNLYMTARDPAAPSGTDLLLLVDPATGAATLVGDIGFAEVFGLAFEGGSLYGFTSSGKTLLIDTATGQGTQVAVNGLVAWGAASLPGAGAGSPAGSGTVSAPGAMAVWALGLALLYGTGRRRVVPG